MFETFSTNFCATNRILLGCIDRQRTSKQTQKERDQDRPFNVYELSFAPFVAQTHERDAFLCVKKSPEHSNTWNVQQILYKIDLKMLTSLHYSCARSLLVMEKVEKVY